MTPTPTERVPEAELDEILKIARWGDYQKSDGTWAIGIANQSKLKSAIHAYAQQYADRLIGEDDREDKPFATQNGGVSNLGQNYIRNKLRAELRSRNQEKKGKP